jgi:hypothetical protein
MPEGVTEFCQGFAAETGDKPGAKSAGRRGDKSAMSGVTNGCHPNMREPPTEVPEQEERENAHAREASQSDARAPVGAASEERTEPAAARPEAKGRSREGARAGGAAKRADSGFLELQKIWVRPWCDDDIGVAWLEYDRVTREVDPRVILSAARAWVEAADAPRFLQSLFKWLITRGWERPPPSPPQRGKPRRENVPNIGRRERRNGGKPDLAQIALAQGRRIQAERAGQ